jgi:hypothetical protein
LFTRCHIGPCRDPLWLGGRLPRHQHIYEMTHGCALPWILHFGVMSNEFLEAIVKFTCQIGMSGVGGQVSVLLYTPSPVRGMHFFCPCHSLDFSRFLRCGILQCMSHMRSMAVIGPSKCHKYAKQFSIQGIHLPSMSCHCHNTSQTPLLACPCSGCRGPASLLIILGHCILS